VVKRSLRLAHPRPGKLKADEGECIRLLAMPDHGGTLANGLVYLSTVHVTSVGLHAGSQSFNTGDVVTRYCDVRRSQRTHNSDPSHGRRSGTPQEILEGLPFANRIDRGDSAFRLAQIALPPQDRIHLGPYAWLPGGQQDIIINGGVGYMANTNIDPTKHNVRLHQVPVAGFLDTQLLVATRPIAAHEEIISPYNNTDPLCT
jgi:hypothetical protein